MQRGSILLCTMCLPEAPCLQACSRQSSSATYRSVPAFRPCSASSCYGSRRKLLLICYISGPVLIVGVVPYEVTLPFTPHSSPLRFLLFLLSTSSFHTFNHVRFGTPVGYHDLRGCSGRQLRRSFEGGKVNRHAHRTRHSERSLQICGRFCSPELSSISACL